jgi:type IV secretory pathway VirB10-like protein
MATEPSPAAEVSSGPARVIDRRRLPPGVVPRHLQHWVLVGTAVVMVAILAVSSPPAKPRPTAAAGSAAVAVDPNQQRIEDFQRRIEAQAQRLAAEQAQLQLAKEALAAGQPGPREGTSTSPVSPLPARDTRDERDGGTRLADNVAFSRVPSPPSIAPPMTAAIGAGSLPEPAAAGRTAPPPPASGDGPRYRLLEGTFIEVVLTNRLDGTFDGPVNGLVSVPVYASEHLVIPAGARVLGEARAVNTFGQSRLAVVFHRILLPNGMSLDLDRFRGLNQVGDLGLRDQVDRHYAQIFGASLAIGVVAGFAQGQSAVGLDATALDAYRQGAAANVSQSSARILDRFLNLLPTVTIREGHRIKVYLSNDLELPAYPAALRLPGDRP